MRLSPRDIGLMNVELQHVFPPKNHHPQMLVYDIERFNYGGTSVVVSSVGSDGKHRRLRFYVTFAISTTIAWQFNNNKPP